jgi:GNAT superfamily N-acetyltransferase
MIEQHEVKNTEMTDVEFVFKLFEDSVQYQEKHGYPAWKNYDRNAIIKDIQNKNQYKIIIDAHIAIVFSVCYSDKVIWRNLEKGDSVYLHRIVVNPAFKGKKLFGKILDWAIQHCKQRGLENVRMDTWSANPTIINYYKEFGFTFIENYTTPDSTELPTHNRNLGLTLLEYKVNDDNAIPPARR